jgi:hypothetical protein
MVKEENSNGMKPETLKDARRRTDQRLKQWKERDEAENNPVNSVHEDQQSTS